MSSAILLQARNWRVQNKKQNKTIKPGKTFVQKKKKEQEVKNLTFRRLSLLPMLIFEEVKKKIAMRINPRL